MAVVKVFDSKGVKTVVMMSNVTELPYDAVEVEDEDINEVAAETDDGF